MNRTTIALGLGAAASTLAAVPKGHWQMYSLCATGYIVTLALAAVAVVAGVLGVRLLELAAGLGFLAAAALELVQLSASSTNTLGGNLSTVSLLLGFGLGLTAVAATRTE